MEIIIRKETESDYLEVYKINESAFGRDTEANLVERLRKGKAFIPDLSLVARVENRIAGYILFSKIKIRDGQENDYDSLALAPLAVRPDLQRKGIGGKLITCGLIRAGELGYKSVIVLGDEHYYPRFGFAPCRKWNIKAPFNVPENVFMGIELVPDGLKDKTGTVIYPEEFNTVPQLKTINAKRVPFTFSWAGSNNFTFC